MTSTFTTNIGIEQPANGDYPNDWDVPINADWGLIDQALGSSTSFAFTNANISPTVAQSAFFMLICTGTLTGNVQLILPGAIGGGRHIFNQCTGAFTLTVLNGAGDTGGGVVVPQGYPLPIVLTAGRAYYDNYSSVAPGTPQQFAGPNIPPGFLLCFGQTVSQATYPLLYAALGTTWGPATGGNFTLPDFRGITLAGADNMGGAAAGRLTGYVLGTTGGAQAVTLAATQIPAHTHNYSGTTGNDSPDHTHGIPSQASNAISPGGAPNQEPNGSTQSLGASNRHQHSFSGTTDNGTGGGLSHPNVQPTAAVNIMIRY